MYYKTFLKRRTGAEVEPASCTRRTKITTYPLKICPIVNRWKTVNSHAFKDYKANLEKILENELRTLY